jgi:two-component system sensor histidine kinase MprB
VAATQDLDSKIEEDGDDELGRLARSFNSMLDALGASRQQQAQLISDAGHELRTPLTSLRTNIELLLRRPDLPAADRSELAADVEAQLQELTNLIGDLVDLAQQEERQAEPIEVRFDSLVASAVERARRRAPGITFDLHLTAGSVRAHPALLERAVLNILDNAVKWSPPGGPIEVWLQRGGVWTLDVHDHGPGIASEDLPRVFDRFYRAATARSMPGSGLGLAIVHQVVTNHGGTVSISAPPEGGTVVHLELPTVSEMEAADQPGEPFDLPVPEVNRL